MKLKGTVAEKQDTTGIGMAVVFDGRIWIVYPVDLSCKGKYVGYASAPDGNFYHITRMSLKSQGAMEIDVIKIIKDRNKRRK